VPIVYDQNIHVTAANDLELSFLPNKTVEIIGAKRSISEIMATEKFPAA